MIGKTWTWIPGAALPSCVALTSLAGFTIHCHFECHSPQQSYVYLTVYDGVLFGWFAKNNHLI